MINTSKAMYLLAEDLVNPNIKIGKQFQLFIELNVGVFWKIDQDAEITSAPDGELYLTLIRPNPGLPETTRSGSYFDPATRIYLIHEEDLNVTA